MKASEQKIKASLFEAIDKWVSENCESNEMSEMNIYWGEETSGLMAEAAFSVMKAVSESQIYAIEQGFLKK